MLHERSSRRWRVVIPFHWIVCLYSIRGSTIHRARWWRIRGRERSLCLMSSYVCYRAVSWMISKKDFNFFWRKNHAGASNFFRRKNHSKNQFFLEEKSHRSINFFWRKNHAGVVNFPTCDPCVKMRDVLYDGIDVYFYWTFAFWRHPYGGCVWRRNVFENENGRRQNDFYPGPYVQQHQQ